MAGNRYKLKFTLSDGSTKEVEFVAPQGPKGDKGESGAGASGKDGKSAYQYAKEAGYSGTETEFAQMLASAGSGEGSGCKIQTGSYIGTGTYGNGGENELTFDFAPKILIMLGYKYDGTYYYQLDRERLYCSFLSTTYDFSKQRYNGFVNQEIRDNSSGYSVARKSADGKTLYWQTNIAAGYQFNAADYEYFWIAFG